MKLDLYNVTLRNVSIDGLNGQSLPKGQSLSRRMRASSPSNAINRLTREAFGGGVRCNTGFVAYASSLEGIVQAAELVSTHEASEGYAIYGRMTICWEMVNG